MKRQLARMAVFIFAAAAARPGFADVASDIRSDSRQIAEWFSEEIGPAMAYNGASFTFFPGNVVNILGVQFGLSGGVSRSEIDADKFRNFNFIAFDNQSGEIDIPDDVLVPSLIVHAKIGLPGRMDLGLKVGGANFNDDEDDAKTDFKNNIYGVELRKRFLGGGATGALMPDVAVAVAYDVASGDVTRTEPYNAALQNASTLTGNLNWKSDWNVQAASVRAVVGKKLPIVTPYLGAGFTQLMGDTETTVDTVGTATGPFGGNINESVKAKADADDSIFQLFAGAELQPLPIVPLIINAGYAWSPDHSAVQLGLRLQFR